RCVCGKKIGPDPRNFNQRVSLGRNDLLIRTFLNGLMSMIERTSLIALMPLKLALFYKNHRKYDIKFIQPPPELALKSVQVYASWNKNSRNISTINEMVSMLQTLSSFRR
ncbi:hypothetical protein R3X41_22625, partial [Salmonella enterica subsp. enterica serovar Agona]|nr:hypothetical protein [Salmonella enterica subsp. enterica serovar Agona]